MALPRPGQGQPLAYEFGLSLAQKEKGSHEGIRILVAGAGTLEGLIVAQTHPKAQEVVALDVDEVGLEFLDLGETAPTPPEKPRDSKMRIKNGLNTRRAKCFLARAAVEKDKNFPAFLLETAGQADSD